MSTSESHPVLSRAARGYLRLQLTGDVGPIRARKLIDHFGSLESVFEASVAQLMRVQGIGEHIAQSIFRSRGDDSVGHEIERAAACGVRIVCVLDDDYPSALRHIHDPPLCLYVRGRVEPGDAVAMAMVGTRRCSHYGREQAVRFAELLGRAGFTVVSGLARGIDAHAHRGALQAGGRTIAVLGNGLASVYPTEHESLAEEIAKTGAVISEFPIDTAPEASHFPQRNRIIAGLSLGVIVVEAGPRSGALITARCATDYNREVFAVPGPIDRPDLTGGVNGLIRDSAAKLITCLDDVLDELKDVGRIMRCGDESTAQERSNDGSDGEERLHGLSADEQAVFSAVAGGADRVDRISSVSRINVSRVTSVLTSLQLKGLATRLPGDRFAPRHAP